MYRVIWRRAALNRLANIWSKASDPQAVLDASFRISLRIRQDPRSVGESRQGDLRLIFDDPLGVLFRVDPNNRDVIVINVGLSRP